MRLGGLGLRAGMDHADAAFKASRESLDKQGNGDQRRYSSEVDTRIMDHIVGNSDEQTKLRLSLIRRKRASCWLSLLPLFGAHLDLNNTEFRIMLRLRLGLPTVTDPICKMCNKEWDLMGTHALSCLHGGGIIHRHHALRNWIYETAKEAGIAAVKEKGNLLGSHTGRRPADIFLPRLLDGKDIAADVAVTCPVGGTFKGDPSACQRYSTEVKGRQYEHEFFSSNIVYSPVVFDTFGGLCEQGVKVVREVIRTHVEYCGRFKAGTLWGRLMLTLYRENVKLILRGEGKTRELIG